MKKLDLEYLVGKTKSEVQELSEKNGYSFRITGENDINYMITCDFRTDRINVKIKNNIVIEASLG